MIRERAVFTRLTVAILGVSIACVAVALQLAEEEAELRAALIDTSAVTVARIQGRQGAECLVLKYPASLLFVPDGTQLLPAGQVLLDVVARDLKKFVRTQIVVTIYTDRIGSAEFNQQQSQSRAVRVVAYLESQGIAAARLIARGAGESLREAPERTPEGRNRDRRLEISISPLSS